MAIAFVNVNNAAGENNGATGGSTVPITPTLPASTVDWQTRVFVIQVSTGVSGTTPTDWTVVGTKDTIVGSGAVSAGGGQRYMSIYYRDKSPVWTAMPAFALTSASALSHWIGVVAISKTNTDYVWGTPTISTAGADFGTADTAHSAVTGSFTTTSNGFVIIASVENDNVTSTGGTLTQSGATFGTVTERCDGGTATGNDVAGKVHTCAVTTGATATCTFACTLSGASQGGTMVIQQTETSGTTNALAETLTDDFTSGFDSGKWFHGGANTSLITYPSGTVRIGHDSSGGNGVVANNNYKLLGSSLYFECVDFGNAAIPEHLPHLMLKIPDDNNRMYMYANNGQLGAHKIVNGSETEIGGNITLDTTAHRWWRVRETSSVFYCETSPDGTTWTVRFSTPTPWYTGTCSPQLLSYPNGAGSTSYFTIDNYNTPPAVSPPAPEYQYPTSVAIHRSNTY